MLLIDLVLARGLNYLDVFVAVMEVLRRRRLEGNGPYERELVDKLLLK
jgi:hypothetical protein